MKTATARYICPANATLIVFAKEGKKAITVGVRLRTPDGKSQVGCKDTFDLDKEADALKRWEQRKSEAAKLGWTEKVKTPRSQAFTVLPAPPPAKKGKAA
ncbi:MAG: hypothetical protein IT179_07870 [Acidobacteria bacterium]|nr:hypothetical protein [Acidobacteriota bacterium]